MIAAAQHTASEQTAHTDFAESLKQAVIEQTDNGKRIIRSVVSIMEGDAPNCTPWHQLEAAKLLRKLGIGTDKPPLPQGDGWGEGTHNIPSPSKVVIPAQGDLCITKGCWETIIRCSV